MSYVGSLACLLLALADPPTGRVTAPAAPSALDVVSALESVMTEAIAKAEPSVVAIARVKSESGTTTAVKGRTRPQPPLDFDVVTEADMGADAVALDIGSGVVIGTHGEILTAFHVVQGAERIHARATDKQRFEAEIIAADPRSDLAVIVPKLFPGSRPPKLTPLTIGDASTLRKGTFLIALGNSYNAAAQDGDASASWGILSNVARRLELNEDQARETKELNLSNYPTLLQLDSKLNLGMSGGAVVNLKGELVGITSNNANAVGFDPHAGYAIPMDTIGRRAVEALREGKEVEYGFLGITLDRQSYSNLVMGANVGTPAAEGKLLVKDAILAVGDIPVHDLDTLVLAINSHGPGSTPVLTIKRGDKTIQRTVQLNKVRVLGEVIATNRPSPWRGMLVDYTSALPIVNSESLVLAISKGSLAVMSVEPNSPAARAGLKEGQIIVGVEGQRIRTPQEFAEIIKDKKDSVRLETDEGPRMITAN